MATFEFAAFCHALSNLEAHLVHEKERAGLPYPVPSQPPQPRPLRQVQRRWEQEAVRPPHSVVMQQQRRYHETGTRPAVARYQRRLELEAEANAGSAFRFGGHAFVNTGQDKLTSPYLPQPGAVRPTNEQQRRRVEANRRRQLQRYGVFSQA